MPSFPFERIQALESAFGGRQVLEPAHRDGTVLVGPGAEGAESVSNKDQPSGYAGLDAAIKLKLAELPSSVVSVSSGTGTDAGIVYSNAPVVQGNQVPIYSVADPSGTWPNGTVWGSNSYGYAGLGTPPGVFAPGPSFDYQVVAAGGDGANITKSIQGMFGSLQFRGPTTDDSAQGGNFSVFMKDVGAGNAYTQTNPITALESDVQVEGHVTVSGTYMLGHGSRLTVLAGATLNSNASCYGYKASLYSSNAKGATTYGAALSWRAFYDEIANPAGSSFAVNESFHGVNRVNSEQGMVVGRTGYGGLVQMQLEGTGGAEPALMQLTLPNPSTTTSIADGGLASGSNLMTTATAPSNAWIGRVLANANIPAGTQVLNFYGTGPYTVVMTANATGTASAQTVTITEPTLSGLRINMASGQTSGNAISVYDTGGTQRWTVNRAGNQQISGQSMQVLQSGTIVAQVNNTGYLQAGATTAAGAGANAAGAKIYSGSGAPALVGVLGDRYLRTDTPSTANQREYICTTAGAAGAAVWTAIL